MKYFHSLTLPPQLSLTHFPPHNNPSPASNTSRSCSTPPLAESPHVISPEQTFFLEYFNSPFAIYSSMQYFRLWNQI